MAATDEEENGGGSLAVRKNAFSGLKRTAEGRPTPIDAEDTDRRPFGVLVGGFNGKRPRTDADCRDQGDPLSTTAAAAANDGPCAVADDLRRGTIDDEDCEVKSTDTPTAASDRIAALDVEPEVSSLEGIKPSHDMAENCLTDSQPTEEVMETRNGNDSTSDCDDVSELSGLSDLSMEGRWNSSAGMVSWVQNQIAQGANPRAVLGSLVPSDTEIPDDLDDGTLWRLIVSIISEPPRRKKLDSITTLESVLHLLRNCKKIIVLTGAGVSVSCGIPDFRSRDGIYARLAVDYPDLPDPQAMFDIQYFKRNPRPFFKFAKEMYPGQFQPSLSHRFIGHLESRKQLLRNYTQNIDTLELAAGITRVVQCHGSFAGATCMVCKHKVDTEAIRDNIMNQVIPRCCRCSPEEDLAVLKPDIVFFGESLSEEFHRQIELDKDDCDLLIVIGSSLKVRPVAIIPRIIAADVPQVLINRESLRHLNFDVELLGDCDVIINELCHLLGDSFKSLCTTEEPSVRITRDELDLPTPFCSDVQKLDDAITPEISHLPKSEDPKDESRVEVVKISDNSMPSSEQNVDAVGDSRTEVVFDHCHRRTPSSIKLSSYLKENTYLYCLPRRYVFRGAEVYEEEDSLASDSSDSSSASSGVAEDGDDLPNDRSFGSPRDHGLDELDFSSSGVKTADAATDKQCS